MVVYWAGHLAAQKDARTAENSADAMAVSLVDQRAVSMVAKWVVCSVEHSAGWKAALRAESSVDPLVSYLAASLVAAMVAKRAGQTVVLMAA